MAIWGGAVAVEEVRTLGNINIGLSLFIQNLYEGGNESNKHQSGAGDYFISILNTLIS